jgi:superfamily II DNA or RNA helicase
MSAPDIYIEKMNEAYIRIHADKGIVKEIYESIAFFIKDYQFNPKVKKKQWDGRMHMLDLGTQKMSFGMLPQIAEFATERKYTVGIDPKIKSSKNISMEYVEKFATSLNLHIKDENGQLVPKPFRQAQLDAIHNVINEKDGWEGTSNRSLLLSPTSSGKSGIIYALIRYYQVMIPGKTLLVVPSTILVEQMYDDFNKYSHADKKWGSEKECTKIYSGQEYDPEKNVVISTWQSLQNMDKSFFEQFSHVFQDESHQGTAKQIKRVLEYCVNAAVRVGTTGTLEDGKCDKMVLQGLLGKIFVVTTTKDLIAKGEVSDLKIDCVILDYDDATKKSFKKMCLAKDESKKSKKKNEAYDREVDFIVRCEKRNEFISKIALTLENNTVILYNFVEKHGKPLFERINSEAYKYKKQVFFVNQDTKVMERRRIQQILEANNNVIVIASYGTWSVGVSVNNTHNIIFAGFYKSLIRILQSIGRGGRIHKDKKCLKVIDIVDDFKWKSRTNYALKHFERRLEIYVREGFNYKIKKVRMFLPAEERRRVI